MHGLLEQRGAQETYQLMTNVNKEATYLVNLPKKETLVLHFTLASLPPLLLKAIVTNLQMHNLMLQIWSVLKWLSFFRNLGMYLRVYFDNFSQTGHTSHTIVMKQTDRDIQNYTWVALGY